MDDDTPRTESHDAGTSRCLSDHDFANPPGDRYFEDYEPGAVYEYGYVTVTEPEIVDFAQRYDPQPIHTDPAWAATGPFGGLIASGWQTGVLCMRLYVVHYVSSVASLASPGMDELRWPRPVRPGDVLHLRAIIDAARVSKSKPDRGLVTTTAQMWNQDDQLVMSFTGMNFFGRRDVAPT